MAKIIYLCERSRQIESNGAYDLRSIAERLQPDNIHPNKAIVRRGRGTSYCISNPGVGVFECASSIALGHIESDTCWHSVGNDQIDGSYAIFRTDGEYVEIVTDATASRTIWYYFDARVFVASTSQRAITMILGTVESNNDAIVWMLSTGTLGPVDGWDRRCKRLSGASCGRLNIQSWEFEVTTKSPPIEHTSPVKEPRQDFRSAIEESVARLNCADVRWVLPLSGGYDSRAILLFLLRKYKPATVTWGIASSASDPMSDAYIARKLAISVDVKHQFIEIERSSERLECVLSRFIRSGEGRIDHVSGYIDGFNVWKRLNELGVEGIIRGDECFGWGDVFSPLDVPASVGIYHWGEFTNLPPLMNFGLAPVATPAGFNRLAGETIYSWRDRLYQQFRIPVMLAALSDLKLPYVEIANPFLTARVIRAAARLMDSDRNNKMLFRSICESLSPPVPFATRSATDTPEEILRDDELRRLLSSSLTDRSAAMTFEPNFISFLLHALEKRQSSAALLENKSLRSTVNRLTPPWLSSIVKRSFRTRYMNMDIMAFRAYIVVEMYRLLREDGKYCKRHSVA